TEFASEPKEAKTGGNVAITADGKTLLWVIKKEQAVVSKDLGKTWALANGLPVPAQTADWVVINLRPAADRVNPNKLYVYDSADGVFYVSTDAGGHFEKTASNFSGLPDYARASGSMKTVPGFEGHIWVTTGKELMRSVDSGKTFEAVKSTEASHAVGFGAPGPGRKYPAIYLIGKVGGKDGFFRSDDAGNTWVRINDDKHQYGFTGQITGDPKKYGRVYIGTGGRGILYGDVK
ncbi:MAG TPA: xyloglucanase, partial [Polyangiaceae bacterium]